MLEKFRYLYRVVLLWMSSVAFSCSASAASPSGSGSIVEARVRHHSRRHLVLGCFWSSGGLSPGKRLINSLGNCLLREYITICFS